MARHSPATETSNKRKRGRPPNASTNAPSEAQQQATEQPANDHVEDVDEAARPRKRGRPMRTNTSATDNVPPAKKQPKQKQQPAAQANGNVEEAGEAARPRKRGRPAQAEKSNGVIAPQEPAVSEATAEPESSASQRGRPHEEAPTTNGLNGTSAERVAEGEAAPKRRGRPAREPISSEDVVEKSAENGARKKRGKPTTVNGADGEKEGQDKDQDQPSEESASVPKANARRTRDSNKQPNGDTTNETTDPPQERPKQRGRPAREDEAANDGDTQPPAVADKPLRKRRGGRDDVALVEAIPPEPQPEMAAPQRKKRGRPAATQDVQPEPEATTHSQVEDELAQANEPTSANIGQQRRGRKPKAPDPPVHQSPAENEEAPSRAGRKRRERSLQEVTNPPNAREEQEDADADSTATKKRGRRRAVPQGASEDADENENGTSSRADKATGKKRASKKPVNAASQSEGAPPEQEQERARSPSRPYRYLQERIRYVPCTIVNNEWDLLKPSSVASVQEMLSTAERTVFESVKYTRDRKEHVGSALAAMSRRLTRQICQVPFPPAVAIPPTLGARRRARAATDATDNDDDGHDAGRGDELRFETVLNAAEGLERRLDPLKHSIKVLESEKKSLADDIERQRKKLEQLTTSTKNDRAFWRERLHNAHRLAPYPRAAPDDEPEDVDEDEPEPAPAFTTDAAVGSLFKDLQADGDLRALAGQLSSHVESMRTNAKQIDGVLPAIAKSSSALRMALLQNLDQKQYEKVLFGQ